MKKIGFFGGTFDPIHLGHLHLAETLAWRSQLDEVWFCPAYCSVFKMEKPPEAAPKCRLDMLQLALEEYPTFKICLIEIEQKNVCYTIDTLRSLFSPNIQFHLLLSQESWLSFPLWKEFEEILRIAPPLIGERSSISSTEIRRRIKQGLSCRGLLPDKVLDYIIAHKLYLGPANSSW